MQLYRERPLNAQRLISIVMNSFPLEMGRNYYNYYQLITSIAFMLHTLNACHCLLAEFRSNHMILPLFHH